MTEVRLTAPYNRILTVLHIIDQAAPWVEDLRGDRSTNGTTKCGLPMLTIDNWLLLEQMPGETICPRCLNPAAAADVQEEAMF